MGEAECTRSNDDEIDNEAKVNRLQLFQLRCPIGVFPVKGRTLKLVKRANGSHSFSLSLSLTHHCPTLVKRAWLL
jgi:hypothetical protein